MEKTSVSNRKFQPLHFRNSNKAKFPWERYKTGYPHKFSILWVFQLALDDHNPNISFQEKLPVVVKKNYERGLR